MPRSPSWVKARRALFVVAVAAGTAVYVEWFQPWFRRWGATDAEIEEPWAADMFVEPGVVRHTRAITIEAPVSTVWAWLAEIGQDQAGFYSYTALENLVGARMRNVERGASGVGAARRRRHRVARRPRPLGRDRAPGPARGRARARVRDGVAVRVRARPQRRARESATGASGSTRSTAARARASSRGASGGAVGTPIFDLLHFVMEQAMMRGLKHRAEAAR